MDESLFIALGAVVEWLEHHSYRYAVIGGVANQQWGIPRLTQDIDIKVLVPDMDYPAVRAAIRNAFPDRGRPHAPPNPLIVDIRVGEVAVDLLLAIPGYEELIVTRAMQRNLAGLAVRICSAEDLIIQKAVAGRAKDWQDVEGILIEQQGKLNLAYLDDWLVQFAEVLEQPEIVAQYQAIQARIAAANGGGNPLN
jgi:predicted nucleotidyltransferase